MRKRILSARKGKALRRILTAAAALLLANHFLMVGFLFPFQALRRCEEQTGSGWTAVVCRDWAREVRWDRFMYLTGNEEAVLFSEISLGPLGWSPGVGQVLDCTKGLPLYAGWRTTSEARGERGASILYIFGRVDDPDIARLEVQAQYEEWKTVGGARHTALTWDSGREDWMERDGKWYFLFRTYPPFDWSSFGSCVYPLIIGYDEAGEEIARLDVEEHWTEGRGY